MPTFTVAIRGTKFRPQSARIVANELQPGETVTIEPEPSNEFDPNALKIIARDEFIGFVQKDMAAHIAPALGGASIEAKVSAAQDTNGLYFIEIHIPLPQDNDDI